MVNNKFLLACNLNEWIKTNPRSVRKYSKVWHNKRWYRYGTGKINKIRKGWPLGLYSILTKPMSKLLLRENKNRIHSWKNKNKDNTRNDKELSKEFRINFHNL